MRLVIGVPWEIPIDEKVWIRLANLTRPEGVDVEYVVGKGFCPAARHVDVCQKALDLGADLILICGGDQVHPRDMLMKLIRRHFETGGGVITALVPFRGYIDWVEMEPFQKMAWRIENDSDTVRVFEDWDRDKDMLKVIDPAEGDLQRVHLIGSGVLMFHVDHLRAIKKPWFYERCNEDMKRVADQDSRFVWRLQSEAGAQVWVDTTINVKHLHAIEIDESFPQRFKDWKEEGKGDGSCRYGKPVINGPRPPTTGQTAAS